MQSHLVEAAPAGRGNPVDRVLGESIDALAVPVGDDGGGEEAGELSALRVMGLPVGDEDRVAAEYAARNPLCGESGLSREVSGPQHLAGGVEGADAPEVGTVFEWHLLDRGAGRLVAGCRQSARTVPIGPAHAHLRLLAEVRSASLLASA